MGISLNPLVNINPQVVGGQQPTAPNPFEGILAAYFASQQNKLQRDELGQRASANSAEMEQRRQEHELRMADFKLRQGEQKKEQMLLAAQGDALKQLLPSFIQMGGASSLMAPQAQQQGGMPQVSAGLSQAPPAPRQGPMQAFSGAVGQLPSEAVPSFVQHYQGLATQAQGKADRLAGIERAAAGSSDPSGARDLLFFTEVAGNVPSEVLQQLFPKMFPQDRAVDPQQMNAATALFRLGTFTWGQARRQAGLPKIEGIPDDVKFNPFPTRPVQDQRKAGAQLDVMVAANPTLNLYSEKQAPGIVLSYIKGGKAGSLRDLIGNQILSAEDRQFLQASRNFVDSWVRVVSGAATTEDEYRRFIGALTETSGDDARTREQKRNMRGVMIQAVSDIAGGARTRVEAIDGALRLNWSPEYKAFLQRERTKALKYEADLKAGRVSIDPTAGPPGDENDLRDALQNISYMISTGQGRP